MRAACTPGDQPHSHLLTLLSPSLFTPAKAARTDVDALERCVAAIAFGDLDAEPGGRVSEVREGDKKGKRGRFFSPSIPIPSTQNRSFFLSPPHQVSLRRLFRVAQLTVQYLLHVQDRLGCANAGLKVSGVGA